jgi:microcystin-dependent protein
MSFAVNVNPDVTNDITYYLKNKALDRTTTNIGDIKWSAITYDSHGWLLCNGRSLSRTEYKKLFEVIGTQFGSEDENSFNLPDCRSRVLGAIGQGDGLSNRTMGQQVGRETHTLIVSEIPSHNHSGTTGDYTHNHGGSTGQTGSAPESETVVGTVAAIHSDASVAGTNTHSHTIASDTHAHSISSQGGGQPHNNMQPTLFIGNVFIFAGYQYRTGGIPM